LWRLALRSLKRRKARTALTVLGITVVVMLSLLFLSVGYSTENKVIPSFQKLNIDLIVLQQTALAAPYSSINESVAYEIQSYPEVSAVYPYIIQVLTLIQGPGHNQSVVINALLPSHVVDFYRVEPVSGSYITDTTNDSIAVGVQAAKVLGLKAGDIATFGSSSTNQINLKVAGIFTTFGTVDDYDINMALPLAQKLFDKDGRVSAVILKLFDKAKADEIKSRIESAHPDLVVKTSDQYVADFSGPIRVLQGSITLISGLAVAAGVFGVSNTMLMAVVERRREIGIMRAIGTGTGQVLATFLEESLVLGVVGGSAGILLGLLASNILTIPSLIGITITLDVPFQLVVEAAGIALGTALLGAIYPALRAARLRVADALHAS
jgi:putative ABC transport system permease protein